MIGADPPLLSVLIPVFNEAATIAEVIRHVRAAAYSKEIIVVDDASTDGTWRLLQDLPIDTLLRHETNRGKGSAIRTGLRAATGEISIIQDADLEYDPADYPRLIEPLRRGAADVVYGSRYLARAESRELRVEGGDPVSRWGVSLLNRVVKLVYGVRLTDEATCYKAFRTADLRRMELCCTGFEFCSEVTAKACRMGLRILEVPISYSPRGRKEGKKIRWRDGLIAARELWKWRKWRPRCEDSLDGDPNGVPARSVRMRVASPRQTIT